MASRPMSLSIPAFAHHKKYVPAFKKLLTRTRHYGIVPPSGHYARVNQPGRRP